MGRVFRRGPPVGEARVRRGCWPLLRLHRGGPTTTWHCPNFIVQTLLPFFPPFAPFDQLNILKRPQHCKKSEFMGNSVGSELYYTPRNAKFYTDKVCASVTNSMSVHSIAYITYLQSTTLYCHNLWTICALKKNQYNFGIYQEYEKCHYWDRFLGRNSVIPSPCHIVLYSGKCSTV